jgi:TorA maturation chaperone TorD
MSMNTQVAKDELLVGRLVVYSDLAQCFYYPAKPTIALLKGEMEAHLPFYELLDLNPKPHLDAIKRWMQSYQGEGDGGIWLVLLKEYMRLFVIAKPEAPVPPYGSFYLKKKGVECNKTTVEAIKLYVGAGLKIADDFKHIPDHFSGELEFMWYLIHEEIKARGLLQENYPKGDVKQAEKMVDLQVRFMKKRLGRWFDNFLDKVIASTSSVFYCEISSLAKEFIYQERARAFARCL